MEKETFSWTPKTKLGKKVMSGEITSIDEIFERGDKIQEPEIVDKLLPDIKTEIIFIGGSPGKGGGIKRTPTKRTARMHRSGRRYRVSAVVVVGNGNGYLGVGSAAAKEHRDAIEKATANAKLNIIPIKRGCGSWECGCDEKHSIPMKAVGKAGSIKLELIPAPKGIGLCICPEAQKMLKLAGVKDIWSKAFGDTRTRTNYAFAVFEAFKELNKVKV